MRQRIRWLDGTINSMDMSLSKLQEIGKDRKAWSTAVHKVAMSQTEQQMVLMWSNVLALDDRTLSFKYT